MEKAFINIFSDLEKWWNKKGYSPYKEQNINTAGKEECHLLYLEEPLEVKEKERLSNALLEILLESIQYEDCKDEIIGYIEKFPIIKYYFTLVEKIKILIKEKIISKDTLYIIAMEYIKNNESLELIKLGLTLLRLTESENGLNIFKAFSNHNEFILYAIEGIREYDKCNSIIFEITKASRGYGKIIAIANLEPLNNEIKNWIIEKGYENEFLNNILVAIKFNEYDFIEYFLSGDKTKKKYDVFTENLKLLCELEEYLIENITFDLLYVYYEYYKEFEKNFDNIYVLISLIGLYHNDDEQKTKNMKGNLTEEEKILLDDILEEISKEDYSEIVIDELNYDEYEHSDIIYIGIILDVKLAFTDFKVPLINNPVDLTIYTYIMEEGTIEDKRQLLEFAYLNIPFETIANEPENMSEDDLDVEYVDDACLYNLINYIDGLEEEFIDLVIKGLSARYTPTRKLAFNILKRISNKDNEDYIEVVKIACNIEVDINLKRSMVRFLDNKMEKSKMQRYEEVEDVKVKQHIRDIFLTKISLAGSSFIDLSLVEEKLIEGKTVYLKREKNNLYDENAIMILNEDGYLLGYVPRKENYILKNLMDSGKHIYGELNDISSDYFKINISLYLSYMDVAKEVTETFNMVLEKPVGYLN